MAQQETPVGVAAGHAADHADVEGRHAADHAEMSRRHLAAHEEIYARHNNEPRCSRSGTLPSARKRWM